MEEYFWVAGKAVGPFVGVGVTVHVELNVIGRGFDWIEWNS